MKKIICFGAGAIGKRYVENFLRDKLLAFADNDREKIGGVYLGHDIIAPEEIVNYDYDRIVITIDDEFSLIPELNEIKTDGNEIINAVYNQLISLGVEPRKIELASTLYAPHEPRIIFLRHLAELLDENKVSGEVAECGVFRGSFASHINAYFPKRKLYLFDTFEGFKQNDMDAENDRETIRWLQSQTVGIIATGSAFTATLRCVNRENVIVVPGQVPQTLAKCEHEKFAFVNLDMDLYAPQLAALRFFAPRMSPGGVILLHDYYYKYTPGVKQAVDEFARERNFSRLPIGDNSSIALGF
jgi:hypothetical protein